jgi:hypothetical protein
VSIGFGLCAALGRVVEEEIPSRQEVDIVTTPSDDSRSYHVNSDKIRGFWVSR